MAKTRSQTAREKRGRSEPETAKEEVEQEAEVEAASNATRTEIEIVETPKARPRKSPLRRTRKRRIAKAPKPKSTESLKSVFHNGLLLNHLLKYMKYEDMLHLSYAEPEIACAMLRDPYHGIRLKTIIRAHDHSGGEKPTPLQYLNAAIEFKNEDFIKQLLEDFKSYHYCDYKHKGCHRNADMKNFFRNLANYALKNGNWPLMLKTMTKVKELNCPAWKVIQVEYEPAKVAVVNENIDILKRILEDNLAQSRGPYWDQLVDEKTLYKHVQYRRHMPGIVHFAGFEGRTKAVDYLQTYMNIRLSDISNPEFYITMAVNGNRVFVERLFSRFGVDEDLVKLCFKHHKRNFKLLTTFLLEKANFTIDFKKMAFEVVSLLPLRSKTDEAIDKLAFCFDKGVSVNAQTRSGETLLHKVVSRSFIHIEIIDYLIKRGASGTITDKRGNTPLHALIGVCHACSCVAAAELLSKVCDVNAKNNNGWTCLHITARLKRCHSKLDATVALIKINANVHAVDNDNRGPLYWYVNGTEHCEQNERSIRLLMMCGADPDEPDQHHTSPRSVANQWVAASGLFRIKRRELRRSDVQEFLSHLRDTCKFSS